VLLTYRSRPRGIVTCNDEITEKLVEKVTPLTSKEGKPEISASLRAATQIWAEGREAKEFSALGVSTRIIPGALPGPWRAYAARDELDSLLSDGVSWVDPSKLMRTLHDEGWI
jgi:hypothetical protein